MGGASSGHGCGSSKFRYLKKDDVHSFGSSPRTKACSSLVTREAANENIKTDLEPV